MTTAGFLEMVNRNPYLVLLRTAGTRPEEGFVVGRILDRTKVVVTTEEIEKTDAEEMKRRLMGGWLEHWWTREFA